MWPGFDSRTRCHMWVEFVVGSLLCSERFFSGYSGFPLSSKTNISKFDFDLECTDISERVLVNSLVFCGYTNCIYIFLLRSIVLGQILRYQSWSVGYLSGQDHTILPAQAYPLLFHKNFSRPSLLGQDGRMLTSIFFGSLCTLQAEPFLWYICSVHMPFR